MKNELLTFLEDWEQSQEHFYGFKEHWRGCRDLLNVHYRSLLSTHKAIMRPGKRDATFSQSYENHQHQPWGIPYQAVDADYVKDALSLMLHDEYQPPYTPKPLADQIEILYHCLSYFSKNLEYLPLNVQMRLDYILMEISFFVGGTVSAGISVGVRYDGELDRTGKKIHSTKMRKEKVVKPEVIKYLESYLKKDALHDHFENYHLGKISDLIIEQKIRNKRPKNELIGFSKDIITPIVRAYFKEKAIEPPWKQMKK